MAKRNELKDTVQKALELLKDSVTLLEDSIKQLSKTQYDKGWYKGRETGRKESNSDNKEVRYG